MQGKTDGTPFRQNVILLPQLRESLDPQVDATRLRGTCVSTFGDGVAVPMRWLRCAFLGVSEDGPGDAGSARPSFGL